MAESAILLISCNDKKGITAGVTDFVFRNNGNILHADQHIDNQTNTFFMRIEWDLEGFAISKKEIHQSFNDFAKTYQMQFDLSFSGQIPRIAVFVSRHLHCLQDLLIRKKQGELSCEIPLALSNHRDAEEMVKNEGMAYYHFPINPDNKLSQENEECSILKQNDVDQIFNVNPRKILSAVSKGTSNPVFK